MFEAFVGGVAVLVMIYLLASIVRPERF